MGWFRWGGFWGCGFFMSKTLLSEFAEHIYYITTLYWIFNIVGWVSEMYINSTHNIKTAKYHKSMLSKH